MSIGHISCFQEFARASFADEKKRKDRPDCSIGICSNCSQQRKGRLLLEMFLTLWKLYDPDSLFTRHNLQGIDSSQINLIKNSLYCLLFVLSETHYSDSTHSKLAMYCRLRIIYVKMDLRKQTQYTVDDERDEIFDKNDIGHILLDLEKYNAAIDHNRRNHEHIELFITQHQHLENHLKVKLKIIRTGIIHNYARSLFEVYKASINSPDPPHHMLQEAERLMRDLIRENCYFEVYAFNIDLLCRILMCQRKFAEAKRNLSPCLQKTQRVLGPSHRTTKLLLALDAELRLYSIFESS